MLKKSNAFKFLIGTFAVLALGFTLSVGAAMDFGPSTLKVGSKGEYVKTLQTLVGATADGSFGPMTAAKVKAWQASNGLTADGMFGNMSKAKANAGGVVVTPSENLCPNGMTLASNCMTAPSNGGVVSGGAGNLSSATLMGSPSNVQAGESSMNTKVLGFQLRADSGSSLGIQNVRVNLVATGVGSTWPSRYIQGISVWQGANKVGSASVSQLSQNGTTYNATIALTGAVVAANTTSDFFVAVDVNTTIDTGDANNTFNVYVDSIRYVDGTGAILTSSYANTVLTQPMRFLKLSASASTKLTLSEDVTNPRDRTITTNYTSTTNDVSMLKFNVKAEGSNMIITKMALPATATGVVTTAGGDGFGGAAKIATYYKLKYNGAVVSSFTIASTNTSLTPVITFGDTSLTSASAAGTQGTSTALNGGVGQIVINAGSTGAFEVLADVKAMCDGVSVVSPCTAVVGDVFSAGDTLKVEYPSASLLAVTTAAPVGSTVVQDQTGAALGTSSTNRSGSATGFNATFRVQGINSTYVSSAFTPTLNTSGVLTSMVYTSTIDVAAVGNDFFINPIANHVTGSGTTTPNNTSSTAVGFNVQVLGSDNVYRAFGVVPTLNVNLSVTCVSGCIQQSLTSMKIPSGTTARFVVTTTLNDADTNIPAGAYKIAIYAVNADNGAGVAQFLTTPNYNFITAIAPNSFS